MAQLRFNKGIALIELLIAIAISAIIIGLAIQVMVLVRSSFLSSNIRFSSKDILDTTVDIARSIKESSWDSLSVEGIYHPQMSGSQWILVNGEELMSGTQFTRSIQIINVCRDTSLIIVDCSTGTLDPDSKQLVIGVSWPRPISGFVSTTQLVTRYAGNGFWNQTTQSDFSSGSRQNTAVTAVTGGELVLEANLGPGWATASKIISILNITNSQAVNDIAIYETKLFIVKDNDPGGGEFLIYNIADLGERPVSSELGSNGKKIIVSGGYAYIATSDDNKELQIFNISDPSSPLPIGNLNLSGADDAINLGISGSRLYVIRQWGVEKEFNTINITNAAVPSLVSSQDFSDTISDMHIAGKYAYLSTNIDSQEVVIIDLSIEDPASNIAGTFDISGSENTSAINYSYPNIYISSKQNKIYILSAANPTAISTLTQFSINNIGDIEIADNKGFLVDSTSAGGMSIYDLTNPASPTLIGNHPISANATTIKVQGANAFVVTQSSSSELIVVNGGGSNFVSTGVFYSQTLNTNNGLTSVQSISWNSTNPPSTAVQFQIAVNSRGYAFDYLGPDGTPSTYYSSLVSYPLGGNTGQFIKVKAVLSGDGTASPTLNDFRITHIQ